jgi:hypothetical protein
MNCPKTGDKMGAANTCWLEFEKEALGAVHRSRAVIICAQCPEAEQKRDDFVARIEGPKEGR